MYLAEARNDFSRYCRLCVQLLCALDADDAALPTEAPDFFEAVVRAAVQSRSRDSLWSLYHLLQGPCRDYHELIPIDLMSRLDEQVLQIMKTHDKVETQSTSLLCLGIIKELDACRENTSKSDMNRSAIVWGLFEEAGTKSFAALSLLTLQTVWLCDKTDLPLAEAAEIISLATSVARRISPTVTSAWVETKKGQDSLLVLVRKCLQEDICPENKLKVGWAHITLPPNIANLTNCAGFGASILVQGLLSNPNQGAYSLSALGSF